ncbi:GNAT family N-acetyltransferase [Paenibacillus sp. PCH8]|uniref:GNAT family N-acetyltransferase n=1 Tax=Paenibacillus sp. PCH8 TaxID=2066524 RepID=UPI000CF8F0FA|nr:GNAT family N-acetyltransferase [Paenibacillus sp. PCH8]PQP80735.1 GNAT family N-acetyltransferase [Paenibacillus sp. PCH8]
MQIRLAEKSDVESLIQMRLDFTIEYNLNLKMTNRLYQEYYSEINDFLINAIESNQWFIWVAEVEEKIVSHIFLELINKVPRPGKKTNPFVYMTNVYTLPSHRGKGIGSKLLDGIKEWSISNKYEFIIVWPSDTSIDFYKKNEYKHCKEPMEMMLD